MSETNLYDAINFALDHIKAVSGRKAIILVSSGVDTFSKATFDDTLKNIRTSDTPIYVINLGPSLRQAATLYGYSNSLSRIDWKRAENELQEIAKSSAGRMYRPDIAIDLAPIYDDITENLKVLLRDHL